MLRDCSSYKEIPRIYDARNDMDKLGATNIIL